MELNNRKEGIMETTKEKLEFRKDLPSVFKDFSEQRQEAFLGVKKYKDEGYPVIGTFCTYFPVEIAMAAGAIAVSLCSMDEEPIPAAERDLPANLCPLIKASYGHAISDTCPFFYFADIIVAETTCDGKKKMYEIMGDFKETYVLELPNSQKESSYSLWKNEVLAFKDYLEEKLEVKITEEKVREATKLQNEIRLAQQGLYETMANDPAPMSGRELYEVLYGSTFSMEKETLPESVKDLTHQIMEEYDPETNPYKGRHRILITGCPMGTSTFKVIDAIEDNGGICVTFENCGGAKSIAELVDLENPDIYDAISRRYLNIGCSVMTPNPNRLNLLEELVEEYKIDGVVEMTLQACHTYAVETFEVRKKCEEMGIPYTHVETDYSQSDLGQLNTRLTAFLEML